MAAKYKTFMSEKAKFEVFKLQKLLNDSVTLDNAHSEVIVELSKRLDDLILEYYLNNTQQQQNCS